MVRRQENRKTTQRSEEPEFGWNNIVLFKPRDPNAKVAWTGMLQIDARFLEEIIAQYEEGTITMTDDDRIQLRVYLKSLRSKGTNVQYLRGGIDFDTPYEDDEEDDEPAPRAKRGRRVEAAAPARGRGRRQPEPEEEEEDDEPPVRGRGRRRTR